jgi:hypothetical protein
VEVSTVADDAPARTVRVPLTRPSDAWIPPSDAGRGGGGGATVVTVAVAVGVGVGTA